MSSHCKIALIFCFYFHDDVSFDIKNLVFDNDRSYHELLFIYLLAIVNVRIDNLIRCYIHVYL